MKRGQLIAYNTNTVNCYCLCKTHLKKSTYDLYVMVPCGHMVHRDCVLKYVTSNRCPYCKVTIHQLLSYTQVKHLNSQFPGSIYYQYYVNLSSLSNMVDRGGLDKLNLVSRLPQLIMCLKKFFSCSNFEDAIAANQQILDMAKVETVVINRHKLVDTPKVIIANHFHDIDSLILGNLFRCGFLISDYIKTLWVGRIITENCPMVLVHRDGNRHHTVEKIQEFLKYNKTVCMYPEGIATHPKTLIKFRTGAFNTGYPVQPVVLKIEPDFYSNDLTTNIMKTFSQDKITATVTVLDLEYPPFTPQKIESIRHKMAKVGNLALSNVSNRDMVQNN